MFQFTLPRGERLTWVVLFWVTPCFNSRSRVGSDTRNVVNSARGMIVSIHAPAWGATRLKLTSWYVAMFQFTLPRGERLRVPY